DNAAPNGLYLWVVQDSHLWRVDPSSGDYIHQGGADWNGATSMTHGWITNGGVRTYYLFIVQDSKLWRVSPDTGHYEPLRVTDWSGNTAMTFDGTTETLYICQNNVLWRVDPSTGGFAPVGDARGVVTIASAGHPHLYASKLLDGRIYHIDATTGASTAITGIDFAPVVGELIAVRSANTTVP
ncbi:MAG TPA: hypothetical protein VFK05_23430, partial [Polyangiaceae bacterium]|nr:hypothetical protein [Polyangiaceae bacterium]